MGVKQLGGIYLIAVSLAVVVYFIINSFFVANDTFDVQAVWNVLDVLMVIALVIGLVSELRGQDGGEAAARRGQ